MSDLHAWPSQASVDAAMRLLAAHRDRVRDLVHQYRGDENTPVWAVLQAEVFALDAVQEQVRQALSRPAAAPMPVASSPSHGDDTQAWLVGRAASMRRNRGPQ